jgi:hypothetical protein
VTALDDGDMERSGRGGPGASDVARQFDGLRRPRVPESDDEQPAGRVTVADGATTRAGGCEQLRDGPDSPREVVAPAARPLASSERPAGSTPSDAGPARWAPPAMTAATGGSSPGCHRRGRPGPPERARRPWESSRAPDAPVATLDRSAAEPSGAPPGCASRCPAGRQVVSAHANRRGDLLTGGR